MRFCDLEDLCDEPVLSNDSKKAYLEDVTVTMREISKEYYNKKTKGAINIAA